MSMQTFVLDEHAASVPATLFRDAASGGGGVEVLDDQGKIVAFVLSPHDREAWTYAEARMEVINHRDEIRAAMQRRGGVTTKELLERAEQVRLLRMTFQRG
jgi:hypothetical protein